jgi:hypothetical protein
MISISRAGDMGKAYTSNQMPVRIWSTLTPLCVAMSFKMLASVPGFNGEWAGMVIA